MGDIDVNMAEGEETPIQPSDIFPNDDTRQACLEYVCAEIADVRDGDARKGLEERWEKWRRQRRAIPESKTRDTPWINAANIEPPLTQQKCNTIYAKEAAAFASKKPRCTVEPLQQTAGDTEIAAALQKFLEHLLKDRNGLDWDRRWPLVLFDQVSLGTDFVKVPFILEQWSFKKVNAEGQPEDTTFVRHQGPAMIKIRLEDFFTRPHWKDLETAPWVAVRYRYFAHELRQKAASGEFDTAAVDTVLLNPSITLDDNKAAELSRSGIDVTATSTNASNSEYEIFEVNVYWDIDGTGVPVDIQLFIHLDSRTILRSQFNKLSVRDIEPVLYFENPDVLYGIGVAELSEPMQDEVTTLHRMRLDGIQLAMQKNFIVRRGCGVGARENIEPMKIWQVDAPQEDFRVIEFPDIAPSCVTAEMIAKDYADRVTGASDHMAGFNDQISKSGTTASGTMFLANQANSILSSVLTRAQVSATNIILKALYQCVANKEYVDLSWMDPNDQILVRTVFDMGVENLPTRFRFNVEVTDLMKTDEARRQSFLAANQIYMQYIQQMVQIGSLSSNPQFAQNQQMLDVLRSAYVGMTKFMEKSIEFFDVGIASDFLPFTKDIEFVQAATDSAKQQQLEAAKEQLSGQISQAQGTGGQVSTVGGNPAGYGAGGGAEAGMAEESGGGPGGENAGQVGAGYGPASGVPTAG